MSENLLLIFNKCIMFLYYAAASCVHSNITNKEKLQNAYVINKINNFTGNAEVYIMLALLIGVVTVVIGCWLSDNCWSPEPEHVVTVA